MGGYEFRREYLGQFSHRSRLDELEDKAQTKGIRGDEIYEFIELSINERLKLKNEEINELKNELEHYECISGVSSTQRGYSSLEKILIEENEGLTETLLVLHDEILDLQKKIKDLQEINNSEESLISDYNNNTQKYWKPKMKKKIKLQEKK